MEKLIFMKIFIHIVHVFPIVININIWTVRVGMARALSSREKSFFSHLFYFCKKILFSFVLEAGAQLWKILESNFNFHLRKRCFMYPEAFKSFRSFSGVGKEIILKKSKAHDQNIKKKVGIRKSRRRETWTRWNFPQKKCLLITWFNLFIFHQKSICIYDTRTENASEEELNKMIIITGWKGIHNTLQSRRSAQGNWILWFFLFFIEPPPHNFPSH